MQRDNKISKELKKILENLRTGTDGAPWLTPRQIRIKATPSILSTEAGKKSKMIG